MSGLIASDGDGLATVLPLVLSLAEPNSLAIVRTVSRVFKEVASDPQVRRAAFVHHWGLRGCLGKPRQPQFLETATLLCFAYQHMVQHADSLQMLAVRYGTDLPMLKRVNNLMTDHSLHSRTHLFIPVANKQDLVGQVVRFCFCPLSARDFAVLQDLPHGQQQLSNADRQQQQQQQRQGPCGIKWDQAYKVEALQAKLCQMLGRSLYIDDATAKFYLEDANGDMKAAMEAFAQDLAWEGTTAGPIRTVPALDKR
eukprot:GHRR01005215.1.p1 GENE.GHRR01005215.1~~GHRR01005215.1.p1  ORF type:complete len:254 (+),score=72.86 GHRR01005215.1:157-918(+)